MIKVLHFHAIIYTYIYYDVKVYHFFIISYHKNVSLYSRLLVGRLRPPLFHTIFKGKCAQSNSWAK